MTQKNVDWADSDTLQILHESGIDPDIIYVLGVPFAKALREAYVAGKDMGLKIADLRKQLDEIVFEEQPEKNNENG